MEDEDLLKSTSSRKRAEAFRAKFAKDDDNGSYKLTAIGCFDRHKTPRKQQLMTTEESNHKMNNVGLSRSERCERGNYGKIKPGMTIDQITEVLNSEDDNGLRWR